MKPLTLDEMEEAGRRANQIKSALKELEKAERDLQLLRNAPKERENFTVNHSWKSSLILKKGGRGYYDNDITVEVEIPYGVVQQQLVYRVQACRRRVIELGGMLP